MASKTFNPTYNSTIGDSLGLTHDKAFILFDLSAIPTGAVISAASLLFTLKIHPSASNVTVAMKSSNANVTWDETTVAGTLDAYTLSSTINSFTINSTDTNNVTTYTVDVLGGASSGITEAWALGKKATLVGTAGTLSPSTIVAGIVLSNLTDNATLHARTDSAPPVLTVTYTARGNMIKIAMDGHSF